MSVGLLLVVNSCDTAKKNKLKRHKNYESCRAKKRQLHINLPFHIDIAHLFSNKVAFFQEDIWTIPDDNAKFESKNEESIQSIPC